MAKNRLKKVEMKPGVKYKGYATLNEYGEIQFTPEQTGVNQGKFRVVKEGQFYSIGVTPNFILVRQKLAKKNCLELITEFMKTVNMIMQDLRSYEF